MTKAGIGDRVIANIDMEKGASDALCIRTLWDFECYGPDGNLKWEERNRPNIVTTEGLNSLLEVYFRDGTQIAAADWFIAPIETDTTAVITQTYAVPVFTEWDGYTEAARQAYTTAAASGGSITNTASKATFTASENKTLYGGGLFGGGTDAATWKDTAGGGTLFCYSKFASSRAVESGDTFKITIAITIANT